LGGVLVLRPGNRGVAYEYKEKQWGDHAPDADILAAVDVCLEDLKPKL
jgi:hypothetical protein